MQWSSVELDSNFNKYVIKILGSKKNPILFGVGMLANKLMKLQLWGSVWIGNLSGFSTFQEYRIKIAYEKWKRCIT